MSSSSVNEVVALILGELKNPAFSLSPEKILVIATLQGENEFLFQVFKRLRTTKDVRVSAIPDIQSRHFLSKSLSVQPSILIDLTMESLFPLVDEVRQLTPTQYDRVKQIYIGSFGVAIYRDS